MPSHRRASVPKTDESPEAPARPALRTLKKYPNRRLYDTQTSSYITLADVKQMVLEGISFEVRDAKTGEELTRSILLQIILEEESGGVPMFSTTTLAQIIRFYGHAMQGAMGTMLEKNMAAFAEMQAQFLNQSKGMGTEAWTQFVSGQTAAMQGLMERYVEGSRSVIDQVQKAGALFPTVPGFPPKR